jgi:4-alpha-glucanotransferase
VAAALQGSAGPRAGPARSPRRLALAVSPDPSPAPPLNSPPLHQLAARLGILPEYLDQSGREVRQTPDATRVSILAALGFDAGDEPRALASLRRLDALEAERLLPPARVAVWGDAAAQVTLRRPASLSGAFRWRVELVRESGETHEAEGRADAPLVEVRLPGSPPLGYHRLRASLAAGGGERAAEQRLIVVPPRCPDPAEILGGARRWGVIANLYAVRRAGDWGVGDLTSLGDLLAWSAARGAAFVGVNPLHALRNRGWDVSPYSPVSRLFRNTLYLDVEQVPELAASAEARAMLGAPELRAEVAELNVARHVQYERVAALKRPVLAALHRAFAARHRGRGTARAAEYARYLAEQGEALTDFATFCALEEWIGSGGAGGDRDAGDAGAGPAPRPALPGWWREWPSDYQDPRGAAVARWRDAHEEAVDFHRWQQFELDRQLAAAAARGRAGGMPLGLYQDLAIGTAPNGSDPWAFPGIFLDGVSVGAPPDAYARQGQDWGLPPLDPRRLAESGYDYFVRLVRAGLRHGGALRIDHVLGFFRQFWIPHGMAGSEGAYVAFPTDDLFGILALESTRARAVVVGEDLGTVPPEVPAVLHRWGVLSSKVMHFERDERGGYRGAAHYPALALATADTHDMATLEGFWSARDVELRGQVGLLAGEEEVREAHEARGRERWALVRMLRDEGLLPHDRDPSSLELRAAVHAFLRRTPAWLVGLTLEDLVGEVEPVNMPGVPQDRFSSWTRRLAVPLEALRERDDVQQVLGVER